MSFDSSNYINVHWGTKTLYQPLQKDFSNPPKDYEAVFINYVGRHGARHLTSINADSIMFLVLKEAEKENALTIEGKKLKRMDSLLLIVEKGNVSFISERGKQEQQEIGKRMAQGFSSVFDNKDGYIKISTTKKARTKQSSEAFLKGLNPQATHSLIYNYNDNDNLAFYDISPTYKSFKDTGSWKTSSKLIQKTANAKKLYTELPSQFFTQAFVNKLNSNGLKFEDEIKDINYNSQSFVNGFYSACSIVGSIQEEIKNAGYKAEELDFASLVSPAKLEELDYINSATDFLIKSSGINENGIQVRIAAPLLVSFLNSTEEYITSKKVIADLRFGHAETIAPFAALLGITGASEPISADKVLDYNQKWKCENIIPLSANIQWILYKEKTNSNYLIKFLLNEKEVTINGLKDSGIPYYYNWNDVKSFYISKLEKMGVHLTDNMHDYLMNVK
jgi:hypothetical protein